MCKLNQFSHATPFLHKLHWLPIHYHILFKYNLLTYKATHFTQPPYLSSLIRQSDLTWGNLVSVSSSKPNKCSGLCSFTVAAPTEWIKLPQAIRTMGNLSFQIILSSTIACLPYLNTFYPGMRLFELKCSGKYLPWYICVMVESPFYPVENPTGTSTSGKSQLTFYQAKHGRKSNLGDLGIALGSEIKLTHRNLVSKSKSTALQAQYLPQGELSAPTNHV